jgi:hypothetical protein
MPIFVVSLCWLCWLEWPFLLTYDSMSVYSCCPCAICSSFARMPLTASWNPPNESEYVTEGSSLLAIPSCLSDRDVPIRVQRPPKERYKAVEAKE